MPSPLMPKATAVWLIENTTLTFEQIADFCDLHLLEIQAIADGEVAAGMIGVDPVANGQLDLEDIHQAEKDPSKRLHLKTNLQSVALKKERRYTPVARRQDRPNAIAWLLKYHPELSDNQIVRLLGTTKTTINAVKNRTHWNAPNIKPRDPVLLGICSQEDLNEALAKAKTETPSH